MAWRAICDRCGQKMWNHELRKEWTGLMVCSATCWEPRHPQDFVKGKPDKQNPPWVRPEPEDDFILSSMIILEDGGWILLEQNEADANDVVAVDDGLAAETDIV